MLGQFNHCLSHALKQRGRVNAKGTFCSHFLLWFLLASSPAFTKSCLCESPASLLLSLTRIFSSFGSLSTVGTLLDQTKRHKACMLQTL